MGKCKLMALLLNYDSTKNCVESYLNYREKTGLQF